MPGQLLITVSSLFLLGALLMAVSHRRSQVEPIDSRTDWIKYTVFALIILTILAAGLVNKWLLGWLLVAIAIYGTLEISNLLKDSSLLRQGIVVGSFALLTLSLAHVMMIGGDDWFGSFAYLFLLVATFDSYSQLWGKLFGRHKLCPTLSPGKTWEGFWGGLISTVVASQFFSFLLPWSPASKLVVVGVAIALAATAGDLMFSAIKRKFEIKDFSHALPGHGGMLDRFDSLIVAAPVFYWAGWALNLNGG